MSLVDEQIQKLVMREIQIPAIQPYQERSLRTERTDGRNIRLAEVLYEADIIFDIRQHQPAPLLPFPEGSNCSNRSKERRLIQFVGREPRIELAAYLLARNDGISAHDTRNVEGLGRSLEGDADIARMVADRCKRSYPNGLLFY